MEEDLVKRKRHHERQVFSFPGSPAASLRAQKSQIVARWMEVVKREVNAARDISSISLIDLLPEFLDDLADSLERGKIDLELAQAEDTKSIEHGAIRAGHSHFSLTQVQDEYRILQQVLLDELQKDKPLSSRNRELIYESILYGMRGASAKFSEIMLEREREALREAQGSAAALNALVHSAPMALGFLDRDLRFITVNENLAKMNGVPLEAHLGKTIREVLPEKFEQIERLLRGVIDSGNPVLNYELEPSGDQDSSRWLLASYFPVKTNEGNIIGVGGAVTDITDRKQGELRSQERETALRETQERYDFALSAGRIGVWEMALDSLEFKWSQRQYEIFGLDPHKKPIEYGVFLSSVHREDRVKVDEAYRSAVRESRDFGLEFRILHPEKGIRWLDAAGHIYFDVLGNPERMIGVNFDITEAKNAEIRRSEKARLLNLTHDAVLIVDEYHRILYWNKGAEATYEFPQEEAIGKVSPVILKSKFPIPLADIDRELLERGYWSGEVVQTTKSGRQLTVLRRMIFDKREDGTIRILKTDSDITERKRYEESLRESEARFRELANALPQIIWTARPDGFIDWYNDWWYQYIDCPDCTGWDDERYFPMHPEDMAVTKVRWAEAREKGEPFLMEQRFRRGSDGEYRWHLVRAVPIRGSNGLISKYVGANTDIHDQKLATQALIEERALRERFVNTLTHDLRNPLAAAKMSAQIVLRYRDDVEKRDRHLPKITEAIERADRMIEDLLDANKIKAGETLPLRMIECDLRAAVIQSLDELSVLYGDRFILRDDGPCIGQWSCEGVRRVVDNLATNAVKYGAPDAPITVTIERTESLVRLLVHNEGNELNASELEELFSLYRRSPVAEASGVRGWGIGLTLVRGLVEAHGGNVTADSGEGRGTTFIVELPIGHGGK